MHRIAVFVLVIKCARCQHAVQLHQRLSQSRVHSSSSPPTLEFTNIHTTTDQKVQQRKEASNEAQRVFCLSASTHTKGLSTIPHCTQVVCQLPSQYLRFDSKYSKRNQTKKIAPASPGPPSSCLHADAITTSNNSVVPKEQQQQQSSTNKEMKFEKETHTHTQKGKNV